MADSEPTVPDRLAGGKRGISPAALLIGLRYLLRKKLSYLAISGIALSVGTLIVVMSVFTGFHRQLTGIIRGYLSDLVVQPSLAGSYSHGLADWPLLRRKVLGQQHVAGAAPFIQTVALLRLPNTDFMNFVFVRGIDPDLEPTVSEISKYMIVGEPADLNKTYPNPDGGRLRACFVGKEFPGFTPDSLRRGTGQLILVTATPTLDRRLRKYAVNGMFETGNYEYDSQMVILGLDAAMDLVDSGGAVTGLSAKLDDYANAEIVRTELQEALDTGTELRSLHLASQEVGAIAMSGSGSRVALLDAAGRVQVWDAAGDAPLREWAPTGPRPTALALDRRGERAVIGREDGSALVRSVEGDEPEQELTGQDRGAVTCAAVSRDGFSIVLGHADGIVSFWESGSDDPLRAQKAHDGPVTAAAFDRMSERAVTVAECGTIRIWDLAAGTSVTARSRNRGQPTVLTAVAWRSDGTLFATGDADGGVVLRDAASGQRAFGWDTASRVLSLGFGQAPFQLVTVGPRGAVFWTYHLAGPLSSVSGYASAYAPDLTDAAVSADGDRVLFAETGGGLKFVYGGPGFVVQTWEDQRKNFLEAVAMERFLMALILSLILIVAEFFIFAIVTTIVNERRRDIGILKAVGFTRSQICQAFLTVGLALGVAGAALGVAGGYAFADNINAIRAFVKAGVGFDPFPATIYYFKDIPTEITWISILVTAGGAVVCSLIFSIIPALRAARLDPVQTLHYE